MTFAEYVTLTGINWTTLKAMRESPAHYHEALVGGSREDTPSLFRGRLVHVLTFEPGRFEELYAVWDGDRRGAEYKAFAAANEGREIVKPSELRPCQRIAAAIRRHPVCQRYLTPEAVHEHTVTWADPGTGLRCKARLDWAIPSDGVLLDLKTTRSTDRRLFGRQAASLGYHCQLEHYAAGMHHGLRSIPHRILIVAVESAAPYDVAVFEVDEAARELARETVDALLARVKECTDSGSWPGRYEHVETLDLPGWLFGDGDPTMTFDTETTDDQ